MAEIMEVFEDAGQNAKKLLKSKPFLIACGVVALIALFVAYKRSQTTETSEDLSYYDGSQAIGYAGYPDMMGTGGGGSYDSQYEWYASELEKIQGEYEDNLSGIQGEYDEALKDMQNEYDSTIADILASKDSGSSSSSGSSGGSDMMAEWKKQQEYQADLAQMKANSELYNVLGNDQSETKKALHQQNLEIAEKYGFEYDSKSGNYFTNSGSVVYTTSQQQAKAVSGKTTKDTSSNKVTFDANVDYQARINEAVKSGASQSTINQLKAQRQAKIDAVYGGVDPDTKKK